MKCSIDDCLQQIDIYKGEVDELQKRIVLSSLFSHSILLKPFSYLSKVLNRLKQDDFCTCIQWNVWVIGVDDLSVFYDELIEEKDERKGSDDVLSSTYQSQSLFTDCFVWYEAEDTKNMEIVQNEVIKVYHIHH